MLLGFMDLLYSENLHGIGMHLRLVLEMLCKYANLSFFKHISLDILYSLDTRKSVL